MTDKYKVIAVLLGVVIGLIILYFKAKTFAGIFREDPITPYMVRDHSITNPCMAINPLGKYHRLQIGNDKFWVELEDDGHWHITDIKPWWETRP